MAAKAQPGVHRSMAGTTGRNGGSSGDVPEPRVVLSEVAPAPIEAPRDRDAQLKQRKSGANGSGASGHPRPISTHAAAGTPAQPQPNCQEQVLGAPTPRPR